MSLLAVADPPPARLGPPTRVIWETGETAFTGRLALRPDGTPEHWNGWLCPYFDRANAEAIVAYNKAHEDTTSESDQFSWHGDELHGTLDLDTDWEPEVVVPVFVDGEPWWPLGAWAWTWQLADPR